MRAEHAAASWPRGVLLVALTCLAYHRSLAELAGGLGSDMPVAYVGLVPVLALVVGVVKARPRPGEARLPHRQADWIVAVPLLGVAALVAVALPDRLSYDYWTNRIDLLGLPFFVGGLVAVLFGGRVLYRVRLPVAALALAWPLPYELVTDGVLAVASAFTVRAVGWAAPALGVARAAGGTLFTVGEGAGAFGVNVAPRCAGANSALGFLLVGGAVTAVTGGSRRGKAAWLATGLAVQPVLNVARILLVLATGDRYGERVAIEWLHPYVGLAVFGTGVALLVRLLPRFGVPLRVAAAAPASRPGTRPRRLTVVLAAAGACALAAPNAALARFDAYRDVTAAAPAAPVGRVPPAITGWAGRHAATIAWARPYFGAGSTWERLSYAARDGAARTVFADVVTTDDLGAFSRMGLRACYRFHDHDVTAAPAVDVGAPAPAQALAYADGRDRSWSVVSWVVPVGAGRFQRVTLLRSFDGSVAGGRAARADLVAFARALVAAQRRA